MCLETASTRHTNTELVCLKPNVVVEPLFVMSIKYAKDSRPIIESNRLIQECLARGMYAERLFGEKGDSPVLRCLSVRGARARDRM
jgi:hypothetical protein